MGVAIIFGAILALGAGAYAAFAAYAVAHGAALWPFVVGLPFAYLAFPLTVTAFWMYLGWRWRSPRPRDVELTPRETLHYFWDEFKTIAQAPKMIFYALLMPDPKPAPAALPVLLLHGIGCNAAVWTGMRRHLEREGLGPVYALSYGPPFASIETFAPQVAAQVAQIERDTGASQVVMVCHSMGGLVARTYIRRYGGAHVRRLMTLGTPHAGSRHAWLMHGDSLTEMRPGSAYLADLQVLNDQEAVVPSVSLWSWHDSMVTPQVSSNVDWMKNIVIAGVAHNALLGDRGVQEHVASEIRKARAQQAQSIDAPRASIFH
jgi:triacylglycerol esterase/lipase EstA (alpha/beta hydrolase family)